MNTGLRKKAKNNLEKYFFTLINNAVFGKTIEYVRKHNDMRLATIERRRNYLISESNYHTIIIFSENLLVVEMRKNADKYEKTSLLRFINIRIK